MQIVFVDEFDLRSQRALHLDIQLEAGGFVGMNDAHESGLAKIPGLADNFLPVLKHAQADQRQLHFRREAIVHANQRRRSPAASATDVIFVDHHDLSRLPLGEMKRDRCVP